MNRTLLRITALMLLTGSASVVAFDWSEYEARYSLYRNGKLAGKVEMTMTRDGDQWTISTQGNGTHGLARLLRAKDKEQVVGTFKDGRFFPAQFEHRISVAGIGSEWSAQFDWDNDTVMVDYDKKTFPLPLEGAALDGLSLKIEMQRRLREGDENMQYLLLDEDEIKKQEFRVLPTETLETSLGCLETIPVERVRKASSTRYTRAWHAPALEYLTVRVEHGKIDGDHLEMRIAELQLADKPFTPGMGCSAKN